MTGDDSDFNRHKAVQALEEVPYTDDRYEARSKALEHLNAVPIEDLKAVADELASCRNKSHHGSRTIPYKDALGRVVELIETYGGGDG